MGEMRTNRRFLAKASPAIFLDSYHQYNGGGPFEVHVEQEKTAAGRK